MIRSRNVLMTCLLAAMIPAPMALGQTVYPEVESNNTKATGTPVTLLVASGTPASADRMTGTCSTTDIDYWHITVGPLAAGIYRNVLTVAAPTSGNFTHTIRGLSQASGVVNPASDVVAMTATVPTTSGRSVSWYGFGRQEQLDYTIAYSSAAGAAYSVSYNRASAAIVDVSAQTLYTGAVTVRVRNVSGSLNTDCWIYDANLNPLVGDVPAGSGPAGADRNIVAPAGTALSSFIRTLPAGMYYLAVAGSNLANNQAAHSTDTDGWNSPVLQYADAALCSVATGAAATFFVDFQDGQGHTVTSPNIVLGASWGGNVNWVKFMITEPALPAATFAADPNPVSPGSSTNLTVTVTPATGGASADITGVSADISALTSTPPTSINLTSSDGGVTWTGTAPVDAATSQGNKTIPYTVTEGGPVPGTLNTSGTVTVGPVNDRCSGAIEVMVGSSSTPASNQYAGTNDGPPACVALVGKGVWYKVTPAVTGAYRVDTCGSGFNTILSVYQIGDCANNGTWTPVACNDDAGAGVCPDNQTSAAQNVVLTGGATYYLRVESMNNSGTFTTGNVVLTVSQTGSAGACCNNASGVCTLTTAAGCNPATGGYSGDNSVCDPTPCAATGTCCDNASGACSVIYGGSCPAGTTPGVGIVCDGSACPAAASCCEVGSGACVLIYGGNCPNGYVIGAGTACGATACPVTASCCQDTSGACILIYGGNCPSGYTQGVGLSCDVGTCPVTGVCCEITSGACVVRYGATCPTGYSSGVGTTCDASACPVVGVCCSNTDGACVVVYGSPCPAGQHAGSGTTCDAQSCPPVHACCSNSTGACTLIYSGNCPAGTTVGAGLTCEATTCDVVRGACCEQQTGMCTLRFAAECSGLGLPGTFLLVGSSCPAGLCFGEHEPNSTTFSAFFNDPLTNPATLASGDSISGVATGSNFDAGNNGNGTGSNGFVDLWLVTTSAQALGIYRHEMTQVQGSVNQGYGLRGRGQVGGAPAYGNTPLQPSGGGTARMAAWYGFGKQEKVIIEPFGGNLTAYVYRLTDTPVTPTVAAGTLGIGPVTMRVVSTGGTVMDADTWLYDSNLNAMTNGLDGPGGAAGLLAAGDPAGTTSSFTRTLPAGTYYLAVAPLNLANDQANDPAEGLDSGGSGPNHLLSYFPDVVLCNRMGQSTAYTVHVELADGSGTVISPDLEWTGTWNGLVHFVQFTVGGAVSGACCSGITCSVDTQANCEGTGGIYLGDATTCTPNNCIGACCHSTPLVPGSAVRCDGPVSLATCNGYAVHNFQAGGSCTITAGPPHTFCCPGNFNQDDVKNVADIFFMLTAWFQHQAAANWDGSAVPAEFNVGDIFAFLANWFQPC